MMSLKNILLFVLLSAPLSLFGVEINGQLSQGSIVSGQVDPGTTVEVMGRNIRVDESGFFIFGLGRNAPEKITLTSVNKKNEEKLHIFSVHQRKYKEQKIFGVPQDTVKPPSSLKERIKKESEQVWVARTKINNSLDFLSGFVMPLKGPITGVYGSRRFYNGHPGNPHYGLDIAAPTGTPIFAPAPGAVELVHPNMFYSGGTLIISHGLGISSTYIHLSAISVDVGQRVKRGDLIGRVGATGRATGPHLDWRINWLDVRLDPQLVMKYFPLIP
jgi:murein DD-endopeptidase MepM/ murein hydrolase activator NlpD